MLQSWVVKKVYKFVLKRLLGRIIRGEIDLENIDVQLGSGTVELKDLELNTSYLNDQLAGAAVLVSAGTIGSVKASICWTNLGSCIVTVDCLQLSIRPTTIDCAPSILPGDSKLTKESGNSSKVKPSCDDFSWESSASGMDESGNAYYSVDDGVRVIARLIERVLLGLQVSVTNLVIRLEDERLLACSGTKESQVPLSFATDNRKSPIRPSSTVKVKDGDPFSMVFRVANIQYGNNGAQPTRQLSKVQSGRWFGQRNRQDNTVSKEGRILRKVIRFSGASVELIEIPGGKSPGHTLRGKKGRSSQESGDGLARCIVMGENAGMSGTLNLSFPWQEGERKTPKVECKLSVAHVVVDLCPQDIRRLLRIVEIVHCGDGTCEDGEQDMTPDCSKEGAPTRHGQGISPYWASSSVETSGLFFPASSETELERHKVSTGVGGARRIRRRGNFGEHGRSVFLSSGLMAEDEMDIPQPVDTGGDMLLAQLLPVGQVFQDWMQWESSDGQEQAINEAELDASVEEFFDCLDDTLSCKLQPANRGLWTWTCCALSAISLTSSLAAGSPVCASGAKAVEYSVEAEFAGVSLSASYDDLPTPTSNPRCNNPIGSHSLSQRGLLPGLSQYHQGKESEGVVYKNAKDRYSESSQQLQGTSSTLHLQLVHISACLEVSHGETSADLSVADLYIYERLSSTSSIIVTDNVYQPGDDKSSGDRANPKNAEVKSQAARQNLSRNALQKLAEEALPMTGARVRGCHCTDRGKPDIPNPMLRNRSTIVSGKAAGGSTSSSRPRPALKGCPKGFRQHCILSLEGDCKEHSKLAALQITAVQRVSQLDIPDVDVAISVPPCNLWVELAFLSRLCHLMSRCTVSNDAPMPKLAKAASERCSDSTSEQLHASRGTRLSESSTCAAEGLSSNERVDSIVNDLQRQGRGSPTCNPCASSVGMSQLQCRIMFSLCTPCIRVFLHECGKMQGDEAQCSGSWIPDGGSTKSNDEDLASARLVILDVVTCPTGPSNPFRDRNSEWPECSCQLLTYERNTTVSSGAGEVASFNLATLDVYVLTGQDLCASQQLTGSFRSWSPGNEPASLDRHCVVRVTASSPGGLGAHQCGGPQLGLGAGCAAEFSWRSDANASEGLARQGFDVAMSQRSRGDAGSGVNGGHEDFAAVAATETEVEDGASLQFRDTVVRHSTLFVYLRIQKVSLDVEAASLEILTAMWKAALAHLESTAHGSGSIVPPGEGCAEHPVKGTTADCARRDTVRGETLKPRMRSPQMAFLLDISLVEAQLLFASGAERSAAEPPAAVLGDWGLGWHSLYLTVENASIFQALALGGIPDARYLWLRHGQCQLFGLRSSELDHEGQWGEGQGSESEEHCWHSVASTPSSSAVARKWLLLEMKQGAVGRGDGSKRGGNALAGGTAGSSLTYVLWPCNPCGHEKALLVSLKGLTLVANGGRLDWVIPLQNLCWARHPGDDGQEGNDLVKVPASGAQPVPLAGAAAAPTYVLLDLYDVAFAYEPGPEAAAVPLARDGAAAFSPAACVLAAAAIRLSGQAVAEGSSQFDMWLRDGALSLLDTAAGSSAPFGPCAASAMHQNGYVQVAREAVMEVTATVESPSGGWTMECTNNQLHVETCADSMAALGRLAAQLQQLLLPGPAAELGPRQSALPSSSGSRPSSNSAAEPHAQSTVAFDLTRLIHDFYTPLASPDLAHGSAGSSGVGREDVLSGENNVRRSGWYADQAPDIVENHLPLTGGGCKAASKYPTPVGRLLLVNMNVQWRLFSGLDWPSLCESDTCSSRSSVEATAQTWERRRSSTHHDECFVVVLDGVDIEQHVYSAGCEYGSRLLLAIKDVGMYDYRKEAPWRKLMGYNSTVIRESNAHSVRIERDGLRPHLGVALEEYRIKVELLPVRLHLHQSQVDFLVDFFMPAGPKTDMSASLRRELEALEEALQPFFQSCELQAFSVCLDYCPKRVDLAALRSGNYAELINLVPWKGVELHLKQVKILRVRGWGALAGKMFERWFEDISASQVLRVVQGAGPISPLYALAASAVQLVRLPAQHYRRDGRLLRGAQKGAHLFLRTLSLEALGLGAQLAGGAHELLEQAAVAVGAQRLPVPRNDGKSHQPGDAMEGLHQASEYIVRAIERTLCSLVSNPARAFHGGASPGEALANVVWAAPAAAVVPASAAIGALHRTLLGVRNGMDPEGRRRREDKYLGLQAERLTS